MKPTIENDARTLAQRMIRDRIGLHDALTIVEDQYLAEVLFQSATVTQAARMARVHRNTIHAKIRGRNGC